MPLSEHEQKILSELEETLTRLDPRFVKSVTRRGVHFSPQRRVLWGVVGFLIGLLVTCLFFTLSIPLGLVGVAAMFVSAYGVLVNAARLSHGSSSHRTRD